MGMNEPNETEGKLRIFIYLKDVHLDRMMLGSIQDLANKINALETLFRHPQALRFHSIQAQQRDRGLKVEWKFIKFAPEFLGRQSWLANVYDL